MSRQTVQIVEIDLDACSLSYGGSPCTAVLGTNGPRKCFNTFKTCQDTANFTKETLTFRYARPGDNLPDEHTFPALKSVSNSPAMITIGATDNRTGLLGKRSRITVALQDFPDSDNYSDKYADERRSGAAQSDGVAYEPADLGTHFAKLRARNPYMYGRAARVREGLAGDDLANMDTRHFIITEFVGPDASGRVSLTLQDVLTKGQDEESQCPKASNGVLATAIDDVTLSTFDLTPEGIGDSEYPTSGKASMSSEIVSFTRSGDTITLTGRSLDGSEASSHSEDDTFQLCYVVEDGSFSGILLELLQDYAAVPTPWLDGSADWATETDRWLAGLNLNLTVSKPTPVNDLLGFLSNAGATIWADERSQRIKVRVNRPLDIGESATPFDDNATFLENSVSRTDPDDKRVSEVWGYHGLIDQAGAFDSPDNYSRLTVALDASAAGSNEYDQTRTIERFFPFFGNAGDETYVRSASTRLLNRFRDTPQVVTFQVDFKDVAGVASLITVQTGQLQDETGATFAAPMQVMSVEHTDPGHVLTLTAETYDFQKLYGFITENTRSDYTSSTAAQQAQGVYLADSATGLLSNGDEPFRFF